MVAIELGFPPPDVETKVIANETGLDADSVDLLVKVGQAIRRLEASNLREVASTRTLVAAGQLIAAGISPQRAITSAVTRPLTDDPALTAGLDELVASFVSNE
jgi:nitric oxide reductase NorQ protein